MDMATTEGGSSTERMVKTTNDSTSRPAYDNNQQSTTPSNKPTRTSATAGNGKRQNRSNSLRILDPVLEQLLAQQIQFNQYDFTSLSQDSFLGAIKERDQELESIFNRSLNMWQGRGSVVPKRVEEVMLGIFEGYRQSLMVFSKFHVRSCQSWAYKEMGY